MKMELHESKFNTNIQINPENIAELAKLFRMVKHSKRETPDMYLSFSEYNNAPYLSISFSKKSDQNKVSSISNK